MNEKNSEQSISISMIAAILVSTAVYALLVYLFDFYYDLNDDILIADILSGTYSGVFEAHNIQMLYPIAWLYTKLYKVNPAFPWMGASEIAIMWFCMVLVFERTHRLISENVKKKSLRIISIIGMYVCGILFLFGTNLWEMVVLQYTVVCGVMAATAAYLVFTSEIFEVADNIPAIVLVVLAYNMRSEMLLLMCPFLAAAGICKWISEGFSWKVNKKYFLFLGIIIAGMATSFVINERAYSSDEWSEFVDLFDARTQVYDFTGIPDYESNKAFYDSEYATKEDYDRMVDYNYALSARMNAGFMEDVAEYALKQKNDERSLSKALFENIKDMLCIRTPGQRNKMTVGDSAFYEDNMKMHIPFNVIVIILYGAAIVGAILTKDIRWAYMLPVLFVMRTISWGYVLYNGRVNARIAHPMYFIEILILIAMLLMAWIESNYSTTRVMKVTTWMLVLGFILAATVSAVFIPSAVKNDIRKKSQVRDEYNIMGRELYKYTSQNTRNYYFIDVYSTVNFTQKVFEREVYKKANTQLAGGWAALSPIDVYKQSFYPDKTCWYFISNEAQNDRYEFEETIESPDGSQRLYVYRMFEEE